MKIKIFTILILLSLALFVRPYVSYAQSPTPSDVITLNSDGTISDIEQEGSRIYVGGNFKTLQIDGKSYDQENYAIIDIATRTLIQNQQKINGPVDDVLIYDGRVYVSGEFTQVNDNSNPYLVIFDQEKESVITNALTIGGPAYSMGVHNNMLYVGGNFDEALNQQRMNLFEYNIDKDTLTEWSPQVNDVIYDVYIADNKMFIGGNFNAVDGKPRTQLAAFDLGSKTLLDWAPKIEGTVTNISLEDKSLIIITYQQNSDETRQEIHYRIDPKTGEAVILEEAPVNTTPVPATVDLSTPTPSIISQNDLMVDKNALGFVIPSLGDILTFAIRSFFAIAGLAAMFYLLLGAFNWVVSGGDKDSIAAARDKIQAAVVGLIMMVVVLSIIWTLEQIIFKRRICLGISCPVTLPSLLDPI